MKEIRYGIIGLGNQGSYYCSLFKDKKIDNATVVALCDINNDKILRAKEMMNSFHVAYFNDYKELVDSKMCDAVIVVTPHYFHPEIAEYCFGKNIPVLCDKPAGVYTKQVREMNELSIKNNAVFGMMFNQRTNSVFKKMREIIINGEIGDIQRVTWIITDWYRTQAYYDSGNWRATWNGEGGGVLINQCPHQLDLIEWVTGMVPVSVNAFCEYGKWHDVEIEDEVTAYFKYDNGASGMFITTTGEAPGTNRFEVSGTKGKVVCENNTELYFYKNSKDSLENIKKCPNGFEQPECEKIKIETDGSNKQHLGILNNFTNYLLGKEELYVNGLEGIKGVELMNAIELSGWLGGAKVTIPVDENKYLELLNEKRKTSRYKNNKDLILNTSGSFGNGN